MHLKVVGCSHHSAPISVREQLAFNPTQVSRALALWQSAFTEIEGTLLSTCNRVELYAATEGDAAPTLGQIAEFLATFHGLSAEAILPHLYEHNAEETARHLFRVTASLDSMVLGEPQILSQVKEAYQLATAAQCTGPLLHALFQAALKTARRVAGETTIQQRRVSIPSVAVVDFAQQIFERFDDKNTLVLGAGDMAEETLHFLQDQGVRRVTVVNRSFDRAGELAQRWHGHALPWDRLPEALVAADLVISTTGADEPVVRQADYDKLQAARQQRPLFILDLAVPRDFEPAIGDRPGVFLYSIDDLEAVCRRNREARDAELPAAVRIVEQEMGHFMGQLHYRATHPIIRRLHQGWQKPKDEELRRLFNKLPGLEEPARDEIRQSFDRLLNKLLHPPLESLRDESRHAVPIALLDALSRLFRLKD